MVDYSAFPPSMSPFEIETGMNPWVSSLRVDLIDVGYRLRGVDPHKVAAIKTSIEELGLRMPITVVKMAPVDDQEERYRLVAGAHRLAAICELGREHIGGYVVESDDLDAELWEIDENLCRAELTPADRALFVFRRKEIYLLKHPETAHGVVGNGREKSRQVGDSTSGEPKRFTTATATATGQSERAIQRDAERGEKISEKALRMLRGTHHDKGVVLDRLKSLREPEQEIYVKALFDADKVKEAEAKEVRTNKMATKRAIRTGIINAIAAHGTVTAGEMPHAAFPIGYADPPWEQEAWSEETGQDKGLMYPPMPLADIMALCAGDHSPFTPDAKLYLWVPTNRIDDGIEVLKAWGFVYVSAITWDKVHMGMGREVRDRTEHLLIGKRGDFPGLAMGSQTESLYSEVRGGHSRKPVWFAEQIERLYPDMRKIELFQRKASLADGDIRLNGNWEFWGFEAGGDIVDEKPDSIVVSGDDDARTADIVADAPAKPPKKSKKATKASTYEEEKQASRERRRAYRETIPVGTSDEDLIFATRGNLQGYHGDVVAGRDWGMEFCVDKVLAVADHLYGLPIDYDWNGDGGPPKGNGRFGCLRDAMSWLGEQLAAPQGEVPMFGQKGRFLIDLLGCRVDFRYGGLLDGYIDDASVVDLDKPFISETGYRGFQVSPNHSTIIHAGGFDVKSYIERVCLAQLTEGGKKKVKLVSGPFDISVQKGDEPKLRTDDYVRERRKSDPAYLPGGYLYDLLAHASGDADG